MGIHFWRSKLDLLGERAFIEINASLNKTIHQQRNITDILKLSEVYLLHGALNNIQPELISQPE